MEDWWSAIDYEVLALLEANGAMAPADLGRKLGLSEAATVSCLTMLAAEGRVRIRVVDLPSPRRSQDRPGRRGE